MNKTISRKSFLTHSAAFSAGAVTLGMPQILYGSSRKRDLRIGFIGTGLRGRNHVKNILLYGGVHCPAFCDIDPDAVTKTKELIAGLEIDHPEPKVYSEGATAYQEML
ncbi:MAG: hypothetical protein RI513_05070, partial [Balneolaceae bacterium]|nr:hypothetical protein [Balneolaceae bacterium]